MYVSDGSWRFEAKFPLASKGYSESEIAFAKAALSNMVGGIGYFYGAYRMQGEYNADLGTRREAIMVF